MLYFILHSAPCIVMKGIEWNRARLSYVSLAIHIMFMCHSMFLAFQLLTDSVVIVTRSFLTPSASVPAYLSTGFPATNSASLPINIWLTSLTTGLPSGPRWMPRYTKRGSIFSYSILSCVNSSTNQTGRFWSVRNLPPNSQTMLPNFVWNSSSLVNNTGG